MVNNEFNLRAGVYKVQTFGTTQYRRVWGYISLAKVLYNIIFGTICLQTQDYECI